MCFLILNAPAHQLTLEEGRRAGPRRKERLLALHLPTQLNTQLHDLPIVYIILSEFLIILRSECKRIAAMYFNQATHPAQPRQRQREDELEACSPAPSSAFQRKLARNSCSVLGENLAQGAHDKSCVILDLFGHKSFQGFSNSNFIKWIVTSMNEFIDVWDLCNDKYSVPSGYPNPTRYAVFLSIPDPTRFSFRNHQVAGNPNIGYYPIFRVNPKFRVLPNISGKPKVSGTTRYFGYRQ